MDDRDSIAWTVDECRVMSFERGQLPILGWRDELTICRAVLSGVVLPTDDWQLTGDEFTDEALGRRLELEGHLRSARTLLEPFLGVFRHRVAELEALEVSDADADRERRLSELVAHRLAIAEERIAAARLAAFASGCNEAVVNFIVERTKAVRDGWARRWHPDDNGDVHYPSDADFAVEVGRWCDAYADMLEALPKVAAENGRKMSKADVESLLAELLPKVTAAAEHGAARGAKKGAREGVVEYNKRYFIDGEKPNRKQGGGRKAQFDTNNEQCAELLALGREYRDGKANPPASFSAYADIIIRRRYTASDNPFVYRDTSDGRECGKVRTKLLKRFDTYLKHLPSPMTRDEALPLAGATE